MIYTVILLNVIAIKITVFYFNVFLNVIYSSDAKLHFSASLLQSSVGVDRLSAWPIIGADIKHFTDYRYRPFSKHICRYILKKKNYRIFFFFFYNANKHTIYR